jgi:adenylylsulfate kinase
MYIETRTRSVVKAISWRITATITTIILVYLVFGRVDLAMLVGGFEAAAKILLFFIHERAWNKTKFGKKEVTPSVIWLTGLSGAGKTTISNSLIPFLKSKGLKVEHLDGDTIRDIFPKTGFSKEERDAHVKRVGYLASRLEQHGVFVVASLVSPYAETRNFIRNLCGHFVEVYVSTSLEECEKRDVKGLYKKARAGEIQNFTGIDDPYEPPTSPEVNLNTAELSVEQSVEKIWQALQVNKNIKLTRSTPVEVNLEKSTVG